MAYPANQSSHEASNQNAFVVGELSLEDLERLATSFRPSWELDEAPFAGPASFSPSEIRSLQGSEAHAEVRATVHAAKSESFAPPRSFAPQNPAASIVGPWGIHASVGPSLAAAAARAAARPVAPVALDFSESLFVRSKRPPLIALGLIAAIAVGVGVWATSSGATKAPTDSATTSPPVVATPPAEATTEATAAASPPPPPAEVVPPAVAPPPPVVAPPPIVMAPPVAAAPARVVATPPASRPYAASPAARPAGPKPAARPKAANPTIVRDVPF